MILTFVSKCWFYTKCSLAKATLGDLTKSTILCNNNHLFHDIGLNIKKRVHDIGKNVPRKSEKSDHKQNHAAKRSCITDQNILPSVFHAMSHTCS